MADCLKRLPVPKNNEEYLKDIASSLKNGNVEDDSFQSIVVFCFKCLTEKKLKNKVAKAISREENPPSCAFRNDFHYNENVARPLVFAAAYDHGMIEVLDGILQVDSVVGQRAISAAIVDLLSHHLNGPSARQVSSMLEVPVTLKLLLPHTSAVVNAASHYFESVMKNASTSMTEELSLVIKMCLQIFQYIPTVVTEAVFSHCESKKEHDLPQEELFRIISNLFTLLMLKLPDRDVLLLTGTAVAMLLNCNPDSRDAANVTHEMLDWYSPGTQHDYSLVLLIGRHHVLLHPFLSPSPVSQLALMIGVLKSCASAVLFVDGDAGVSVLFRSFFLLKDLCKSKSSATRYLAFQGLVSWVTCLKRLGMKVFSLKTDCRRIFHLDSSILRSLVDILLVHSEDMVDGIADAVQEIFQVLLDLHFEEEHLQSESDVNGTGPLVDQLLQELLNFPWYKKSRYRLLLHIIPRIGYTKLIATRPLFPKELSLCFLTCNLPSIANEGYRALLSSLKREQTGDFLDHWINDWQPRVLECLQSEDRHVRLHCAQYWIPSTAALIPSGLRSLQSVLAKMLCCTDNDPTIHRSLGDERERLLYGYSVVVATARKNGVMSLNDINMSFVEEGLRSCDEDVRMESFAVICASSKKLEQVQCHEINLIKDFLPLNMNSSSSSLRQASFSSLKMLLLRIANKSLALFRDACKAKRSGDIDLHDANHEQLCHVLGFVSWLLDCFRASILPGASFKRKKSALMLYSAVVSGLDMKGKMSDKHHAANPLAFLSWAQESGSLELTSPSIVEALLLCLEDKHDEVRDMAYSLLIRMDFTRNVQLKRFLLQKSNQLVSATFAFLSSPKVQEAESGAVLLKFLLNVYVVRLNFRLQLNNNQWHLTKSQSSTSLCLDSLLSCLDDLVGQCKAQLRLARDDVLLAAVQTPVFGAVSGVRECLLTLRQHVHSLNHHQWMQLKASIGSFVEFGRHAVPFTLRILSGDSTPSETDVSPSFADIGEALKATLLACPSLASSQRTGEETQHCLEMLLSFCWLSIKAVGATLADLGWFLSVGFKEDLQRGHFTLKLVDHGDVQLIWCLYRDCLTKCRHKGVIESCASSLGSLCYEVSRCPLTSNDCQDWLGELVASIVRDKVTTSVTKRSAGLPLIIQTIVAAQVKAGQHHVLHDVVKKLMAVACEEVPESIDPSVDLKQFHAINVLKALYRDTTLGNAVLEFAEVGVQLTVDGFASLSWSIRSASAMLLGTLVTRMLGHQMSKEGGGTPVELFTKYPQLEIYFGDILEEQLALTSAGKHHVTPRVVPVLTFLSKLTPVASSKPVCQSCHRFVDLLKGFCSSPVATLRDLSATALVAFIDQPEHAEYARQIIASLANCPTSNRNTIHGILLQLKKLLEYHDFRGDHVVLTTVANSLNALVSVGLGLASEQINASCCVEVIQSLLTTMHTRGDLVPSHNELFLSAANRALDCLKISLSLTLLTGVSLLSKRLASLIAQTARSVAAGDQVLCLLKKAFAVSHRLFIDELLSNSCGILQHLDRTDNKGPLLSFFATYCRNNIVESPVTHSLLRMFVQLARCHGYAEMALTEASCHSILSTICVDAWTTPSAASDTLPAIALLLDIAVRDAGAATTDGLCQAVKAYCDLALKWSDASIVETARLSVAVSLHFMHISNWLEVHPALLDTLLPSMIDVMLRLLQDEDETVRDEAAKATADMLTTEARATQPRTHPNCALRSILTFFAEKCWRCVALVEKVLSYFVARDVTAPLQSFCLFGQDDANLYKERHYTLDCLLVCGKAMVQCICAQDSMALIATSIASMLSRLEDVTPEIVDLLSKDNCRATGSAWGASGSRDVYYAAAQLVGSAELLATCQLNGEDSKRLANASVSIQSLLKDDFRICGSLKDRIKRLTVAG